MYKIRHTVQVDASPSRVWRALSQPEEVVLWDTSVSRALDAPVDYPLPGQTVTWRSTSPSSPPLIDQPQEVRQGQRLRSLLRLGSQEMDEIYTLQPMGEGCAVTVEVILSDKRWPGWLRERLDSGPATRAAFVQSLASLKRHCEAT